MGPKLDKLDSPKAERDAQPLAAFSKTKNSEDRKNMKKSKSLTRIEDRMESMDQSSFRYEVLNVVKEFKLNWLKLGQYLFTIKKDKLFKDWDFMTFEAYCNSEIGIKRQTAVKLLNSYHFLEREEPALLKEYRDDEKPVASLPNYETVNALRLAKENKSIDKGDYATLRRQALEEGREPKDVCSQMRSMVLAAREDDPVEAREKRRSGTITRCLTMLNRFRGEMEAGKLVPYKLLKDFDKLIIELQQELK